MKLLTTNAQGPPCQGGQGSDLSTAQRSHLSGRCVGHWFFCPRFHVGGSLEKQVKLIALPRFEPATNRIESTIAGRRPLPSIV
jgi:hypothetical protein